MFEVDYDVWIHIRGFDVLDFEPDCPDDLTEYLFSDECDGEILDVTIDPRFCGHGHLEVHALDPEDGDDEE